MIFMVHIIIGGLAVAASIYDCIHLRLPHALTLGALSAALLQNIF